MASISGPTLTATQSVPDTNRCSCLAPDSTKPYSYRFAAYGNSDADRYAVTYSNQAGANDHA